MSFDSKKKVVIQIEKRKEMQENFKFQAMSFDIQKVAIQV